jgi:hypothetical protein
MGRLSSYGTIRHKAAQGGLNLAVEISVFDEECLWGGGEALECSPDDMFYIV